MQLEIEVATPTGAPTKDKGDLLEGLANDFLSMQNYDVDTQLRVTGSELDLLCKHRVNQKIIYVECKAYRDTLTANVLTNLVGIINIRGYQEGWLLSTGPLGKDAKGLQSEWESKRPDESQKLSIYTPDRIIDALIRAQVIKAPPYEDAVKEIGEDSLGAWMLLITPYGRHWCATRLSGGVPQEVLVYHAKTGHLVTDQQLLGNLAKTDSSLKTLDFEYVLRLKGSSISSTELAKLNPVVQVQHGDNWADYRPARPEDFVGRQEAQTKIVHFLEDVSEHKTQTRVFAITGDSGMGKSSLIAKLRDSMSNQRYRRRFFVYAVDVRAAKDATYVFSSLLSCLRDAASHGFGSTVAETLRINSSSEPLESPSIIEFLATLEQKGQVVCLVFDQFEELYSKPELFNVFEVAQQLFLSTISAQSNLVLGFAWKSDSTVHQSHPAYFMWHRLADLRLLIELGRFRHAEASKAITLFEKELGEKLLKSLRRQLIENSQGFPWLLKKLSIHIYEQIRAGISQSELMDKALDVESLFNRDLQNLSQAERTCLKLIAESAPADWYKVLEASSSEVLRALQDKRLIIKSGDRLNLYWDIFREFVLTQKTPFIPLTYLPSHPSLNTALLMAQHLDAKLSRSYAELSKLTNLNENTVANVIRDLIMFGIAIGGQSQATLAESMTDSTPEQVLLKLRFALKHHALTMILSQREQGAFITKMGIVNLLKEINPAAQHQERTWNVYAERMGLWLSATGYIVPFKNGWKIEDQGHVMINAEQLIGRRFYSRKSTTNESTIFFADASPEQTISTLEWLLQNPDSTLKKVKSAGYRNGARTLVNLRLAQNRDGKCIPGENLVTSETTSVELVWRAASKEPVLLFVMDTLKAHPSASGTAIGILVSKNYKRNWSKESATKVGGRLINWAVWLSHNTDDTGQFKPSLHSGNKKTQEGLFDPSHL
jgi:hypothetical protein